MFRRGLFGIPNAESTICRAGCQERACRGEGETADAVGWPALSAGMEAWRRPKTEHNAKC